MQVSLSKHQNRTVLKIQSGYRCGELMRSSDEDIQYFKDDEQAIQFALKTGYVLIEESSDVIDSKKMYNDLLNSKCDLPRGCKIYALGTQ